MKQCAVCGSPLTPGAGICPICGTPVAGVQPGVAAQGVTQLVTGATRLVSQAYLQDIQGHTVPLTNPFTIGREPGNALVVTAEDVSRRHARIEQRQGQWWIVDLGSRNGSFVDGQQVAGPARLDHGTLIRLGTSIEFIYQDGLQPPSAWPNATSLATGGSASAIAAASPSPSGRPNLPGLTGHPRPALHQWGATPPQVEGFAVVVEGPHSIEAGGKLGKAAMALGLGLVNPVLAFLPFAVGRNQDLITLLRVEPVGGGRPTAVALVGTRPVGVNVGDVVACWGRMEQGVLQCQTIYNYAINAVIRLK